MTQGHNESDQISAGLRKVLNMHGHGFHYAVMRRAEQLSNERLSPWVFEAAEFPVVVGRDTTHIDFILRSRSSRTYLVAECKRVDPARGRWCFAKAPLTRRNAHSSEVVFDEFRYRGSTAGLMQEPRIRFTETRGPYYVGFELKTNQKGDGAPSPGSAINQAVTQVLRGTSGLINHLLEARRLVQSLKNETETMFWFVPVILTTAELWVTETDLGDADLRTGDLPKEAVRAKKVDWIWFTHNRSPMLRHGLQVGRKDPGTISEELVYGFTRSIAIVSSDGVDRFLGCDLERWLAG